MAYVNTLALTKSGLDKSKLFSLISANDEMFLNMKYKKKAKLKKKKMSCSLRITATDTAHMCALVITSNKIILLGRSSHSVDIF